jgi:hypothetical protein
MPYVRVPKRIIRVPFCRTHLHLEHGKPLILQAGIAGIGTALMIAMNVTIFRVVPTPARLKRDPNAKPREYPITWADGDKLIVSIQTITALGYYIAGVE